MGCKICTNAVQPTRDGICYRCLGRLASTEEERQFFNDVVAEVDERFKKECELRRYLSDPQEKGGGMSDG